MTVITIRPVLAGDVSALRCVNEQAFPSPVEADLVDKLRTACSSFVSLVAVQEGQVVGHILFTPVTIDSAGSRIEGMGLAPMAVLPDHQRQGVGSRLVKAGLAELRHRKCPFVIVLGHPEFYPRFGFVPASQHGIRCQWDGIPDEVFMVNVLDEAAMSGVSGVARYRSEFDEAL